MQNVHFGIVSFKIEQFTSCFIPYVDPFSAVFKSYLKDYSKVHGKQRWRRSIILFYSISYINWIWQSKSNDDAHLHPVMKLSKHSHKFFRASSIFQDIPKCNAIDRITYFPDISPYFVRYTSLATVYLKPIYHLYSHCTLTIYKPTLQFS